MAVSFTNHQNGDKFLIGGQASLTGADNGHAGPMPTYDITREDVTLGDGTHVSFRYNITVVGVAANGIQDVQSKGVGQGAVIELQRQGVENINPISNRTHYGIGKLEIAPYGGYENIISFNDARLVSVEMAEPDEETSGTQYQNYTYTFEAYTNTSAGGSSQPTWNLKEASESWSLSPTDQFTYDPDQLDISDDSNKYRAYTLTHTVTATGYKKYGGTSLDTDGHAWRQAATWVRDRLAVSEGLTAIGEDLMGNTNELTTSFHPRIMNAPADTKLVDLITDGYTLTNKIRILESSIAEGRYSATDTYTLVKGSVTGFTTVETSIDSSANSSEPIKVTVHGTTTGLSTAEIGAKIDDKYNNALTEYGKIWGAPGGGNAAHAKGSQVGSLAEKVYTLLGSDAPGYRTGEIFKYIVAFDESHDRVNGTIEWSATFNDFRDSGGSAIPGAYSQKMTSNYANYNSFGKKPNPISVVEKGPFIYLPGTTDEKTATFVLEAKILKDKRGGKPNGKGILTGYYKVESRCVYTLHKPQITGMSESWNPSTGVYTITMTYTYV